MSSDPRAKRPRPAPAASAPRPRSSCRALERLFAPLGPEAAKALEAYPAILRRALALRPGMERELPRRIRELSLSLTAEREGGPKPGYLSDPRTLSAYAWYFLPWNLLRLSRLLPALDLDIPEGGLVCDLGAGPLTLVQALWLSRPDLRRKRLRFVCVDRSRRALDLGLALFAALAGFNPASEDAPWSVRVHRGEYWQGLVDGADMVAMVNVANELADTGRTPLSERMERLAATLAESLGPGGRLLAVEPGTRLGWRCLHGMREALLEMGLGLCAPCPHRRECPLAESRARAWCHFNMSAGDAPGWLVAVSNRADLAKERLSLSFLLARKATVPAVAGATRVVSGAFALTDAPGSAVYGCSDKGLLVLVAPDRRPPRPGDLLAVEVPPGAPIDAKSGAPRIALGPDPDAPPPPGAAPVIKTPPAGASDRRRPPVPAAKGRGEATGSSGPARSGRSCRSGKAGKPHAPSGGRKPGGPPARAGGKGPGPAARSQGSRKSGRG
jgi:SAM-dependent methyltransferase